MIESTILNIGGLKFRTVFQPDLIYRFNLQGQVSFLHDTIFIDPAQKDQEVVTTYLHEIIEAIIKRNQIDVSHDLIVALECGLFQVFMDSPEVAQILLNMAAQPEVINDHSLTDEEIKEMLNTEEAGK